MKSAKTKILFFIALFFILTNCHQKEEITVPTYLPEMLTEFSTDHDAFLSPDGQKIAFYSVRNTYDPYSAGYNFEIWIMEKDGSNQQLLFGSTNSNYQEVEIISWTVDSKNIIISAREKNTNKRHDILKISLTGSKTTLFSSTYNPKNVSYSSDGKKVAYILNGLHIANNDFSEIIQVDTSVSSFSWTNNSEALLYIKNQKESKKDIYDIWKYDYKNNMKTRISNDGKQKYYLRSSVSDNLLFLSNDSLFVTSISNYTPRFIIDGVLSIRSLDWVNNRDLILLRKEQSDNNYYWLESWVLDTNGNIVKKIAPGTTSMVHFSVNGHYYLYTIYGIGTPGGSIWIDYLP